MKTGSSHCFYINTLYDIIHDHLISIDAAAEADEHLLTIIGSLYKILKYFDDSIHAENFGLAIRHNKSFRNSVIIRFLILNVMKVEYHLRFVLSEREMQLKMFYRF